MNYYDVNIVQSYIYLQLNLSATSLYNEDREKRICHMRMGFVIVPAPRRLHKLKLPFFHETFSKDLLKCCR